MQKSGGLNQHETYHTCLAYGLLLLGLFPPLMFFGPKIVAMTFHETPSTLFVQMPKSSYIMYGVGLLMLSVTLLLQYALKLSTKAKVVGSILFLLAIFCLADGSQRFNRMGLDSLIFKESLMSQKHEYAWEDIEKVVYWEVPKEGWPKYDFHFKDGNLMILSDSEIVKGWRNIIERKLNESEIEFR